MVARLLFSLATGLLLASCDAPDPAAFHHKAAMDAPNGTGCHFTSCTNSADVQTTTNTHAMEKGSGPMIPGS
ncbi:MAG TPA: hypothetical protein VKS60_00855 [Stellaceae bacterium]|nr:hypothetical protein [Stellaceae bacterium]